MSKQDNFRGWKKTEAFEDSANTVKAFWKDEFGNQPSRYFMCAFCRFVSARREDFEVDHLVSCKEGGNANRESLERISAIQAECAKPLALQGLQSSQERQRPATGLYSARCRIRLGKSRRRPESRPSLLRAPARNRLREATLSQERHALASSPKEVALRNAPCARSQYCS